jgi:hypothetical protein
MSRTKDDDEDEIQAGSLFYLALPRVELLVQQVQLGFGLLQGLKCGLQMGRLKIVQVRPAEHVVDDRFGRVHPFPRPPQDSQRERPSGRIAISIGTCGGHGSIVKHSACHLYQ